MIEPWNLSGPTDDDYRPFSASRNGAGSGESVAAMLMVDDES
jgi:hypothetical protein